VPIEIPNRFLVVAMAKDYIMMYICIVNKKLQHHLISILKYIGVESECIVGFLCPCHKMIGGI
jgi:hypothetical protein